MNVGKRGIPRVTSARGFCGKFQTLKRIMFQSPSQLASSKEALLISEELLYCQWPHGSDQHLPTVVEQSLKAYCSFWAAVKEAQSSGNLTPRLQAFLNYLLEAGHLSSPTRFIPRWLKTVHRQYVNWEAWNGNLDPFIFSPDNPLLRRMGWGWSYEWSHSSRLWDSLMKQVVK
jgi:hypothetical protein